MDLAVEAARISLAHTLKTVDAEIEKQMEAVNTAETVMSNAQRVYANAISHLRHKLDNKHKIEIAIAALPPYEYEDTK